MELHNPNFPRVNPCWLSESKPCNFCISENTQISIFVCDLYVDYIQILPMAIGEVMKK